MGQMDCTRNPGRQLGNDSTTWVAHTMWSEEETPAADWYVTWPGLHEKDPPWVKHQYTHTRHAMSIAFLQDIFTPNSL